MNIVTMNDEKFLSIYRFEYLCLSVDNFFSLFLRRRTVAEIFLKPFEIRLHRGNLHFRLVRTVRLTWQNKHSDRHVLCFQGVVEFIALRNRNAHVRVAVLNQRRRRNAFDVEHRRMFLVNLHIFPRLPAEIIGDKVGNISSAVKAHQIRYRRAGRCGFETFCLCNNPRSHKTAVAPAHYAQTIRVGNAHFDNLINAAHQILIIGAAPIFLIGVSEILTVTGRAARIRAQNRITASRKSRKRVNAASADESLLENSGRSAVNI